MPYQPILATLGYVLSPDGKRVLLVHRNARADDHHLGKYNGLGGKLEADEDVASGMCRELREEAGIDVRAMQLRGTVSWPGFGRNGEHWLGFLFLITAYAGEALAQNAEGTLSWLPLDALETLPMWDGDRRFLPLVFDGDPRPFHGLMPYRDGRPTGWSYQRF